MSLRREVTPEMAAESDTEDSDPPDRFEYVAPDDLSFDEGGHVRQEPASPSEELVRNVQSIERLVQPVHARRVDGDLLVFDGWRRVQAAEIAGISVATWVYDTLTRAEALTKSVVLNDDQAGVRKTVTDNDREEHLMLLETGERRQAQEWTNDDDNLHNARYRLGIDGDEQRLARNIGGADGVGDATIAALADHFGDPDDVLEASRDELEAVPGVGPWTADEIVSHLERVEGGADVHVVE